MLKKICFVLDLHSLPGKGRAQEIRRALQAFEETGITGEVLHMTPDGADRMPSDARGTLFLCENGETLRRLRRRGLCTAGYSHGENRKERFRGAAYVVQEPDLVDADSYEKMYLRGAGLPWTILETEHCVVREFVEEDLEDLYLLYDEEAVQFLEPPSQDRERERKILRAYIDRIYRLYGFGHWAVLLKGADPPAAEGLQKEAGPPAAEGLQKGAGPPAAEGLQKEAGPPAAEGLQKGADPPAVEGLQKEAGPPAAEGLQKEAGPPVSAEHRKKTAAPFLAGRVGYAVLTAVQEREALRLGLRADRPVCAEKAMEGSPHADTAGDPEPSSGIDADFGFLISPELRGTGIAFEVCSALLQYGFSQLGFARVRADAKKENTASLRLLRRLGFTLLGEGDEGKLVFILDAAGTPGS